MQSRRSPKLFIVKNWAVNHVLLLLITVMVFLGGCSDDGRQGGNQSNDRVTQLMRALQDKNPKNAIKAAEELGNIRDPRSIPALIKSLGDRREITLSRILHPNPLGGMSKLQVRPFVISALIGIGEPAAPSLVTTFKESNDPFAREGVVKVIAYMTGEAVVETILKALKDSDRSVRGAAANALLRVWLATENKRIWEAWTSALKDPDEWIRLMAILQGAGGDRVMPKTIKYLADVLENDASDRVRSEAAEQLGYSKNKQAVNPLVRALTKDPDKWTRCKVAYSLGRLSRRIDPGSIRITKALKLALKDVDHDVRECAEGALKCANNAEDMPFGCR